MINIEKISKLVCKGLTCDLNEEELKYIEEITLKELNKINKSSGLKILDYDSVFSDDGLYIYKKEDNDDYIVYTVKNLVKTILKLSDIDLETLIISSYIVMYSYFLYNAKNDDIIKNNKIINDILNDCKDN